MKGYSRTARRGPSRALHAQPLALAVLIIAPVPRMAAAASRIQFDISPGPAQKSLLDFGDQSHLNVGFSADEVRGAYTNGLDELLEPRRALSRLLEGTSLCPFFTPSGKSVLVTHCTRSTDAAPASLDPAVAGVSTPAPPPPTPTVLVTGTNIHGLQPLAVNVLTISRQDFLAYGIHTTAELFARLPELAASTPAGARAVGNSGLGAPIDLRGQGPGATLVLLNGHRLAGSGDQGAFQDVTNIPLSAIARVDILLDGASARYGSDAVAGVVNFITLTGEQESQFSTQLDQGIGNSFHQALLSQLLAGEYGSGTGVAALEYIHATPWPGPNLFTPQTNATVDGVPGKELVSAYLHVQETLPLRTELTVEGLGTHRRASEQYDTTLAPAIPNASISQKTRATVQMTYVCAESKTAVGDSGVLMLSATRATETARQQNGSIGPVQFTGATTGAASASPIAPTSFSTLSRTDQVSIKFDDTIVSYPAGTLKGALGVESRYEILHTLDSTIYPELPNRYRRDVSAAFGELDIPLVIGDGSPEDLQTLELSAAGRYEHYSDFKGQYTPQYWLRWVPRRGVELRGSFGRSFQAPNLPSLDTSRNAIVLSEVADSQSPTGQSEAIVLSGNNSALSAQTATTESLGARFEWPFSQRTFLNTTLDLFRIHFYRRIQSADLTQLQLTDPSYAPLVDRNVSSAQHQQLCLSKQFYGSLADCLKDPIVVNLTLQNIDSLSTQGMQFRSDWSTPVGAARVELDLRGTWFRQFAERITPSAPAAALLGTENSPYDVQLSSALSIHLGHIELATLIHFLSGFHDDSTVPQRDVPAWTTVDLGVKYTAPHTSGVLRDSAISLTARNILDRPLPLLADTSANQNYDLLGGLPVRRLLSLGFQKNL